MAHGEVSLVMPAPGEVVFDVIHDYGRRLEWDTLLRAAYLEGGRTEAGEGVTSVCVGRRSLGGIALKTVYVSFRRPTLAAVKMVNAPPLFETWAASIRHEDVSDGGSRVTYKFHFTTRPRWLRFILDPLVGRVFEWETRRRLGALRAFLAGGAGR